MQKAQGTIEYLVIIAIIVMIGLVIVVLATNLIDSPTTQINSTSGQLGNTTSGSISIVESVIDPDGDSLIFLNNRYGDSITLTKISTGSVDNNYNEQIVSLDSKVFSLSGLSNNCPCESGQNNCYYDGSTGRTLTNNNVSTYYGSNGITKLNNDSNWVAVDGDYPKLSWQ